MSDEMVPTRAGTPWHLWVIGVIAFLWNGYGAFDFAATMTRFEPYLEGFLGMNTSQIDFFLSFAWWQKMLWLIGTWGGFLGAILLLLRNRLAVWFLGASLAGALASMVQGMSIKDMPEGLDPGPMPFVIISIGALLAVYAWWLSRRDVLR